MEITEEYTKNGYCLTLTTNYENFEIVLPTFKHLEKVKQMVAGAYFAGKNDKTFKFEHIN